jgi:hypothetical protein
LEVKGEVGAGKKAIGLVLAVEQRNVSNRRRAETQSLAIGGMTLTATIGFAPDGCAAGVVPERRQGWQRLGGDPRRRQRGCPERRAEAYHSGEK